MFFKIIHPHEGTFRQKNINPFLALNCQIYVPWLIHHLNNLKNPKKKQTLKFLALGYLTEFMTRSVAGSCNLHASVLSGRMIGHLNDKMALLSFAHRFRFQTNPMPPLLLFSLPSKRSHRLVITCRLEPRLFQLQFHKTNNKNLTHQSQGYSFECRTCFSVHISVLFCKWSKRSRSSCRV